MYAKVREVEEVLILCRSKLASLLLSEKDLIKSFEFDIFQVLNLLQVWKGVVKSWILSVLCAIAFLFESQFPYFSCVLFQILN